MLVLFLTGVLCSGMDRYSHKSLLFCGQKEKWTTAALLAIDIICVFLDRQICRFTVGVQLKQGSLGYPTLEPSH